MIVGRIIGFLLLAAALVLLAIEGVHSVQAGSWAPTPLGKLWYQIHPGSLNLTQAVIQRYLLPEIWDPGISTVLLWPAWVLPALLGLLFLILFRRRWR